MEGIIGRKKRRAFNRFLEHADPRIRRYAVELDAEDRRIRAHWKGEEFQAEADDPISGEDIEALDLDFPELLLPEPLDLDVPADLLDDGTLSYDLPDAGDQGSDVLEFNFPELTATSENDIITPMSAPLRLSDDVMRLARQTAARENRSLQEVINEALQKGLTSGSRSAMEDAENPTGHSMGRACTAAAEYGIDLNQLDSALALTPLQRLICHDQALELVQAAIRAGELHYGIHSQPAEPPERK